MLLIHELPDTVKERNRSQAYAAVWDLMAKLERICPWLCFYGQDTLLENNKTYDEIGIFLPNSLLKNLERHVVSWRRRFFMADKESVVRQTSEYTDIMEKIIWKFHGMIMPRQTAMC